MLEFSFNFSRAPSMPLDGRSMHAIHPYPAKFPGWLAKILLLRRAPKGSVILDPFCGSGTTLLESNMLGMHAVGVDVNALSCLISKVKATPLGRVQISQIGKLTRQLEHVAIPVSSCWLADAEQKIPALRHWFQDNVAAETAMLTARINEVEDIAVRDFLRVSLSAIIVRASNQESDTRYAAINKSIQDGGVIRLFLKKVTENIERVQKDSVHMTCASVGVHNADSRDLSFLSDESFDLVLTSPPYANSYDYYLYHKFRCLWLGLDFKFAQSKEIGSRREFSSLKRSPHKWQEDMLLCLREIYRVLKPGGAAFLIVGDSVIAGQKIPGDELTMGLAKKAGFAVDGVWSAEQAGHSRAFNPAFAQRGKKEHLIYIQKNA